MVKMILDAVPELKPTTDEVRNWLLETVRHSCNVEFFLHSLNLGQNDPQRPHDIVGTGNKFEWEVLRHLATQYRSEDPEFFDQYVLPGINHHRRHQYHHQKWNVQFSDATPEDMKVGAVDAICSHLENRRYQGGEHTFESIADVIKTNHPHQVKWFWSVYSAMKSNGKPDLELITDLGCIPNIGVPNEIYQTIIKRTAETIEMLKTEHGYRDL